MKPKIFFLAAALFIANLSTAQVLYTEDFEIYNTGPFSTDLTGTTPAQGGWYTLSVVNGTMSVNDFRIVNDPNKGNVLQILDRGFSDTRNTGFVYRTDLNTYWQQRTPGNNVLKLAFDIHTGAEDNDAYTGLFTVALYNEKELLTNFVCQNNNSVNKIRPGNFHLPSRGLTSPITYPSLLQITNLPVDSWVTIELYIDYDNNQVYFSVPSLNYTSVGDTKFPLYLTGGGDHDDNPVKLEIINHYHYVSVVPGSVKPQSRKIDNINLSAQNFTPTVSINEFVSEKFNIFPNPATDAVTITNNENIGIKEIAVYDLNGKIVKSQKGKKENEILLNTEDLNSGTYFLHIVTDEGRGFKKLIKK